MASSCANPSTDTTTQFNGNLTQPISSGNQDLYIQNSNPDFTPASPSQTNEQLNAQNNRQWSNSSGWSTPDYTNNTPTSNRSSANYNNDPLNIIGGANSYTRAGNTTYGNDGSWYTRVGNNVFSNDGTTYTQTPGGNVFGSDGSSYTPAGNTIYRNDGVSCTTTYGTYFCTDGTSGVTNGNNTFQYNP